MKFEDCRFAKLYYQSKNIFLCKDLPLLFYYIIRRFKMIHNYDLQDIWFQITKKPCPFFCIFLKENMNSIYCWNAESLGKILTHNIRSKFRRTVPLNGIYMLPLWENQSSWLIFSSDISQNSKYYPYCACIRIKWQHTAEMRCLLWCRQTRGRWMSQRNRLLHTKRRIAFSSSGIMT